MIICIAAAVILIFHGRKPKHESPQYNCRSMNEHYFVLSVCLFVCLFVFCLFVFCLFFVCLSVCLSVCFLFVCDHYLLLFVPSSVKYCNCPIWIWGFRFCCVVITTHSPQLTGDNLTTCHIVMIWSYQRHDKYEVSP